MYNPAQKDRVLPKPVQNRFPTTFSQRRNTMIKNMQLQLQTSINSLNSLLSLDWHAIWGPGFGSNRYRTCMIDGPSNETIKWIQTSWWNNLCLGFSVWGNRPNQAQLNDKAIKDLEVRSRQWKKFGATVNHGNQRDQLLWICHTILQTVARFLTANEAQHVTVTSESLNHSEVISVSTAVNRKLAQLQRGSPFVTRRAKRDNLGDNRNGCQVRMRLEIHRDCRSPRFIEKYWLAPRYCGLFWLRLIIFSNWRSGNLSSRHHVRHWQLRLSWIGKHCCSRYSTHIGDLIVARTNVHWSMPPIDSIDTCASYDWVRPIGMVVCQPLLQSIVPRWTSRSLWIERPWLSQIAWHWSISY